MEDSISEGRLWSRRDPEEGQYLFDPHGHGACRFICFYIFVITV